MAKRKNNKQGKDSKKQEVKSISEAVLAPIKEKIQVILGNIMKTKYKFIIIIAILIFGGVNAINFLISPFTEVYENFQNIDEMIRPQDEVTIEEYDKRIGELTTINADLLESKNEIIVEKDKAIEDKQTIIDLQERELDEKDAKIFELEKQLEEIKN